MPPESLTVITPTATAGKHNEGSEDPLPCSSPKVLQVTATTTFLCVDSTTSRAAIEVDHALSGLMCSTAVHISGARRGERPARRGPRFPCP